MAKQKRSGGRNPAREMEKLKHELEMEKLRIQQEHEWKMQIGRIMEADDEMKYFIGAIAGFGIAGIAAFLEGAKPKDNQDTDFWYGYKRLQAGGTLPGAILEVRNFLMGGGEKTLADVLGNGMVLAGGSVGAFCTTILLFKAMSGDGNEGGLITKTIAAAVAL